MHSDHLFPFTCVDFTSNDTPDSAAVGMHPPARRCGPDGGQTEVLQARLCLGVSFKDFLVAHFLWSLYRSFVVITLMTALVKSLLGYERFQLLGEYILQ